MLFDLDGTLIHTAPDLVGALNDMRREDGHDPLSVEALAPYCSYGGRGLLGRGYGLTPDDPGYREAYDRFIAAYRGRMTQNSRPYDGIRELVARLGTAGRAWGVVTNKVEALAVPLIEFTAFDPAPDAVIGGDTAGVSKPDPAPILLACERMGVDPANCVYVGDSDRDIVAGRAAEMPTIAAGYGYIPVDDDIAAWRADAVVDTPAELWEAIVRLQPDQPIRRI
ncbi:HAD-IA family hydrolase [Salinisphaera sp.]|uniref:HAD family hydrolase n=1 Tax=Salinisphaera sp. TaxID=1914330 RepID=UPI002D7A1973|nr:HAD-IA family hydrolase [Salinisphaera sp.]